MARLNIQEFFFKSSESVTNTIVCIKLALYLDKEEKMKNAEKIGEVAALDKKISIRVARCGA